MEIGLRRLDRFMTEPQRHHGAIDARPRWMASLSRPISSERRKPVWAAPGGSVSGGLEADGLRRRPECRDGVPLGGRAWLGEKCMTPSTQNHTPRLAGNPNPFACPCRFLVLSVSRGSLTGLALAPATVAGVDDERRAGQSIPDLAASASALWKATGTGKSGGKKSPARSSSPPSPPRSPHMNEGFSGFIFRESSTAAIHIALLPRSAGNRFSQHLRRSCGRGKCAGFAGSRPV